MEPFLQVLLNKSLRLIHIIYLLVYVYLRGGGGGGAIPPGANYVKKLIQIAYNVISIDLRGGGGGGGAMPPDADYEEVSLQ